MFEHPTCRKFRQVRTDAFRTIFYFLKQRNEKTQKKTPERSGMKNKPTTRLLPNEIARADFMLQKKSYLCVGILKENSYGIKIGQRNK